jgi:hypothetical protein
MNFDHEMEVESVDDEESVPEIEKGLPDFSQPFKTARPEADF